MLICSCKFDTILRPERSPSFVGDVVSQFWHTMSVDERNCDERRTIRRNDLGIVQALGNYDSGMKWLRISTALTGIAACSFMLAQVAPHAREAGAILAAQDDPAALSELKLDALLRQNDRLVQDNIEAALAAGDADLADSFVALARERNIALPDDLLNRVSDAVKEENSTRAFRQTVRHRPRHRQRRRCREPVRNRRRRSLRDRRHQGRRARGQAPRDGRGHRSAGARALRPRALR